MLMNNLLSDEKITLNDLPEELVKHISDYFYSICDIVISEKINSKCV